MSPIADALILTMTRGVRLADWDRLGILDREWAIYDRLCADYGRILVVSSGGREDIEIARTRGLNAEIVCDERSLGPASFERAAPALVADRIDPNQQAVVKTNQFEGGRPAVAIARELRTKGVAAALLARGGYPWSRFIADREGADSPAAHAAASEETELLAAADGVIATTGPMADDLAWKHAIARERFHIVPNYVLPAPPPAKADTPAPAANAAQHGIERDPAEILYAGQLIERKGVHLLIDAIARLDPALRARLTVIGDGPRRAELESLARDRQIDATFEPRIPHADLRDHMARCAIYAQCSRLEGHPKAIIEAMASGCCVLAADAPGTREVITSERTGLLTPPDTGAIAAALDRLLRDPTLRAALGENARRWAHDHVALDRVHELEREAHRAAIRSASRIAPTAGRPTPSADPHVRFEPALLDAPLEHQTRAWADAIGGFWKRLDSRAGARFVMALDDPLYRLQGHAAIEANGGLHPKHRLTAYHDFFCDRIRRDQRILDLGCGVGALAVSIAKRTGARVTGLDLDETRLDEARARAEEAGVGHLARFHQADIATNIAAARIPGAFDTIVLSNVLEHLTDRPQLLSRWRENSRCDRFLIRVPAIERDWRVPWKRELGVEWRLDPTHHTEHARQELEIELREAGLHIREIVATWGEFWVLAERHGARP